MTESEKETAFLLHSLAYDEGPVSQELKEEITQIQRDKRCLRRAMWLMTFLMLLVLVGVAYAALLMENFLYRVPAYLIKLIGAVGFASFSSLMAYAGLGIIYRQKLYGRCEECRRLAGQLLESRLGRSSTEALAGGGQGNRGTRETTI
jgi:hypothetical protein